MSSRASGSRKWFHRDRVIAKRVQVAREVARVEPTDIVAGRLDDQQYYLGCNRPRCRLCSPHKNFSNADRQRAEEDWRHLETA